MSHKSEISFNNKLLTPLSSAQVPSAQQGVFAIRHHAAQTAVRSCAVDGATTPQESSNSPSASANSDGAVLWSVRTVKSPWIYTHARHPDELNGWTRPEGMPHVPPAMRPHPFPLCRTSCGMWHSGKVCPKVLRVAALPCPRSSLHGFSTCLCESTRIHYPSI